MNKAETLKVANRVRWVYLTLKSCAEGKDERCKGVKHIPVNLLYTPTEEQIKDLSDFILENERGDLYYQTFGCMDLDLLKQAVERLGEVWYSWSEDIRQNLILENYTYIREHYKSNCNEIFKVSEAIALFKAMWEEAIMLQSIFENRIPPQEASPTPHPDTSTPIITDSVITPDTSPTGASSPDALRLPMELDTDRARKYFARAIGARFIIVNETGYKWIMGGVRGALAQLGYFVEKVYCPTNTEQFPEKAINNLFGVNRLASAIAQLHNAQKPQKWRVVIDEKIFYD